MKNLIKYSFPLFISAITLLLSISVNAQNPPQQNWLPRYTFGGGGGFYQPGLFGIRGTYALPQTASGNQSEQSSTTAAVGFSAGFKADTPSQEGNNEVATIRPSDASSCNQVSPNKWIRIKFSDQSENLNNFVLKGGRYRKISNSEYDVISNDFCTGKIQASWAKEGAAPQ